MNEQQMQQAKALEAALNQFLKEHNAVLRPVFITPRTGEQIGVENFAPDDRWRLAVAIFPLAAPTE